jgi:hypothetical protein
MNEPSRYLLLIDGTAESYAAASLCEDLAERTGALVTALHIINTPLLRQLIPFAKPGLVGSGPYLGAYEEIRGGMSKLGECIMDAYRSKFSKLALHDRSVLVEEGDPAEVVSRMYDNFDLIVLGHKANSGPSSYSRSLCQALITNSSRPILIVQQSREMPDKLRLVLGDGVPPHSCLKGVVAFAANARLGSEFVWAGSAAGFDAYNKTISEVVSPAEVDAVVFSESRHPILDADWRPEASTSSQSLPVFFTRPQLGHRITLQTQDTTGLLLDIAAPACLIWPNEFSLAEKPRSKALVTPNA